MKYRFESTRVGELLNMISNDEIDLTPPYQRNFIWSKTDQVSLIDTIFKGYPLPNIFIYKRPDQKFEMVDGQQRTRTIFKFFKGDILSSDKISFQQCDQTYFLDYKLPIIFISDLEESDSLNEFYVLINKKGKPLNKPEVYLAEHFDNPFLKLADDALNYQPLIDLEIFSEATSKRMNDRAFIEELLALTIYGISDKKSAVELAFKNDEEISRMSAAVLSKFKKIVDKIFILDQIKPINKTRYRQKNDFYTLFNFIHKHSDLSIHLLEHQYRILLILNEKDQFGNQFISPSNDECNALKEYATNCVTQSNSKKSRERRLAFFEEVLLNENISNNPTLVSIMKFLTSMYGKKNTRLIKVEGYDLLDVNEIEI